MYKTVFFSIAVGLIVAGCAFELPAQGTQADYQRMQRMSRLDNSLVSGGRVAEVWWSKNGKSFCFWNETKENGRQFFLVDLASGKKSLAFDHDQVAKSLQKKTGRRYSAKKLRFTQGMMTLDDDLRFVFIKAGSKYFKLKRQKPSDIEEISADQMPKTNQGFVGKAKASLRSNDRASFRVSNTRTGTIVVYWTNFQGRPQRFAEIESGKSWGTSSFVGHNWEVRTRSGKTIAYFDIKHDQQVITIDQQTRLKGNRETGRGARRFPNSGFARSSQTSPNKKWRIQIRDRNVTLFDIENKKETTLTTDGSDDGYYVNQFFWSPDSKYVFSLFETPGQSRKIQMIESSPRRQLQPRLHSMTYVKPGDKIRTRRVVLFDIKDKKQVNVSSKLFKTPWSISQFRWNKDGTEFLFRYNQRGHQVMRIVGVNSATGKTRAVIDEQSKTFIDYRYKSFAMHLPETNEIIWRSERDGWNHLYLYDSKTGKVKNQITRGPWVVRDVRRVDREKRKIWFSASGIYPEQDPYYLHECHIDFDGKNLVVMTAGDGTHSIRYSPDRKFIIDTYSRVDMPSVTELREVATGKKVCELARSDASELLATGWKMPQRFVAKGRDGKTDIHGVIYFPSNYDPKKKYPVIEYIYAGPHGSFVPKRFSVRRAEKATAELGFIMVQIDGMGTSNRSKAFHDVCWKNLGDSGFPDRILWMKAAAKKHPAMDLSRVGIYGGSAGGQSSTRALLAFGDFYKVAVSDCGCHDNRMDKIWWNEQWMGWPIGPHYAEQSNVTQAKNLKGKLFLIVGELDRNVDPASTMQVVNALIKANKDFDLLVVPGAGHGIGSRPYGMRRTRDFFVRHLLGVEPRHK